VSDEMVICRRCGRRLPDDDPATNEWVEFASIAGS
jgi:hypothetical protein